MSGSFPDEVKLAFGSWLTDPEDQQEKEDALYSEWEALSARDISDSTLERRRKLNLIHRVSAFHHRITKNPEIVSFIQVTPQHFTVIEPVFSKDQIERLRASANHSI